MKVKTWIAIEKEVEVSVDAEQIRAALSEAFAESRSELADPEIRSPPRFERRLMLTLNTILQFLGGVGDDLIAAIPAPARKTIHQVLAKQAERWKPPMNTPLD